MNDVSGVASVLSLSLSLSPDLMVCARSAAGAYTAETARERVYIRRSRELWRDDEATQDEMYWVIHGK